MTPDEYEHLRNELLDLLAEAAGLESLSESARDAIGRIRKRALENRFKIVLAGEFQGGKSTTFNALCDGRELSPMGSGIKTSGCLVSASNIADPTERERANIAWKSASELVAGFSDLLLPRLRQIDPVRFRDIDASRLGSAIDLNTESDRRLVAEAAELEWNDYEKGRADYNHGNLDALRSAGIVARFMDDPLLRELRGQTEFFPEEVGPMIVFPEDWEQRWLYGNPGAFDVREVLFVFIASIDLKIHSPNLGRLGCVLVDCPGLFASRWDSDIARKAMIDSDAVLYAFNGSRTLKQSDLTALSFVRNNGMEYKLFYGCNMRGHSVKDSDRIFRASMETLEERGFRSREQDQVLFHALLALRAAQAERFLESRDSEAAALDPAGEKTEALLYYDIVRTMTVLKTGDDLSGFDGRLVESAKKAGGLQRLMNAVEQSVVQNKARSILVDNGSAIGVECLLEVEANLRNREISAFQKESDFKRRSAEAENELGKFKETCLRIVAKLDDRKPDDLLADDLWNRLYALKPGLCEKSAERIYREVLAVKNLPALLWDKERLKFSICDIVKSETDESFKEVVGAWLSEIKDGKNVVYNRNLTGLIASVNRELKSAWKDSALSELEFTSGVSIPEFSGDLKLDEEKVFLELEESELMENIRSHAFMTAGTFTGLFTAASGVFVAIFAMVTRIFWIVIASAAVLVANLVLLFLTKGFTEKTLKEEVRIKLSPAYDALFDQLEPDVKAKFGELPASVRDIYKQAFLSASEKPQKIYEARKKEVESDLARSGEERRSIAEQSRKRRETQIRPLRVRLAEFASKVEKSSEL